MKRALAILAAFMVLGAVALGQESFTGKWTATVSFAPLGTECLTTFPSFGLSSSFTLTYTNGGLVLSSVSGFGLSGYTSQKFTASLTWGAFTLSSTMKFIPSAVTAYTNVPGITQTPSTTVVDCCGWTTKPKTAAVKFDDWTVKMDWTFAGIDIGGLLFVEQGNYDKVYYGYYTAKSFGSWDATQTQSSKTSYLNGAGLRFKLSAPIDSATLSVYIYSNLSEWSKQYYNEYNASLSGTHYDDLVLGKADYGFEVLNASCDAMFSEAYILLEGLTFTCSTVDMALTMTCEGFDSFDILFNDLPGLCCGITFDALISFSLTEKSFQLTPKFSMDYACVSFDIGVDYSNHTINGFKVYGLSISYDLGDCLSFSSDTSFDSTNHKIASPLYGGGYVWDFVPEVKDTTAEQAAPLYKLWCIPIEKYTIWEKFSIKWCGPGCCGGNYTFTVTNYFGDKYVLDKYGYAYRGSATDAWTYYVVDFDYDTGTTGTPTNSSDAWEDIYTGSWPPSLTSTEAKVYTKEVYTAGTNDNLFGWVKTSVSGKFPIMSTLFITGKLDVTVFGLSNFSFGFEFTF